MLKKDRESEREGESGLDGCRKIALSIRPPLYKDTDIYIERDSWMDTETSIDA